MVVHPRPMRRRWLQELAQGLARSGGGAERANAKVRKGSKRPERRNAILNAPANRFGRRVRHVA
jgi:hypothetical protein